MMTCLRRDKRKIIRKGVSKNMSTFQFVVPTEEQKAVMQKFRDKYESLAIELKSLPSNRGLSLALTKLEESAFWLNKAITGNL